MEGLLRSHVSPGVVEHITCECEAPPVLGGATALRRPVGGGQPPIFDEVADQLSRDPAVLGENRGRLFQIGYELATCLDDFTRLGGNLSVEVVVPHAEASDPLVALISRGVAPRKASSAKLFEASLASPCLSEDLPRVGFWRGSLALGAPFTQPTRSDDKRPILPGLYRLQRARGSQTWENLGPRGKQED